MDAIEDDHRDHDAESRFADRQDAATSIARSAGDSWHGWEFWYVVTEYKLNPAETAATWAPDAINEAYFYLRLAYLRSGG